MDLDLRSAVDGIFVCPDCGRFHYEKDGSMVSEKYCFICEKKKSKRAYIMPVSKDGGAEDELNDGDVVVVAQVCEDCMRSVFGMSGESIKFVKSEDAVIRKILEGMEKAAEQKFDDDDEEEYSMDDIFSLFESHYGKDETVVYREFDMDGVFKDIFKGIKEK